jgi:hypothetical protein
MHWIYQNLMRFKKDYLSRIQSVQYHYVNLFF